MVKSGRGRALSRRRSTSAHDRMPRPLRVSPKLGRRRKKHDASNPSVIQTVEDWRKRLRVAQKLFRKIAAPPERTPYAAPQPAAAPLCPLRVPLANRQSTAPSAELKLSRSSRTILSELTPSSPSRFLSLLAVFRPRFPHVQATVSPVYLRRSQTSHFPLFLYPANVRNSSISRRS